MNPAEPRLSSPCLPPNRRAFSAITRSAPAPLRSPVYPPNRRGSSAATTCRSFGSGVWRWICPYRGQGLGGESFLAAGERALAVAAEIGGTALVIDAKDENVARWYDRFGALIGRHFSGISLRRKEIPRKYLPMRAAYRRLRGRGNVPVARRAAATARLPARRSGPRRRGRRSLGRCTGLPSSPISSLRPA